MAVYVELTTDPFDVLFAEKATMKTSVGAGLEKVRRPLRGIEIRDDTHAYIKLIRVDGKEIPMFDSSDPTGESTANSNFILQSVQEQRMERHQIVETFGETYLFLFGESPRFLNIQAVLLDTLDFNWKSEFMANYEKYLRGTKCVEMGARTYLFYNQQIVEGYILNAQVQETADAPHVIPLSFQLFVTNSQNISMLGTGEYPTRESAFIPEGVELTETMNGEQIELLIGETLNEQRFGNIERDVPIRGLISDNHDEYTTPLQPSFSDLLDKRVSDAHKAAQKDNQEVDELAPAVSNGMEAYGVDPSQVGSPYLLNQLGMQPTFLPAGVGVGSTAGYAGAFATFGASSGGYGYPMASGYGYPMGYGGRSGFSSYGGAYAGVGASAYAGSFAGTRTGYGYGGGYGGYGSGYGGYGGGNRSGPYGRNNGFAATHGRATGYGAGSYGRASAFASAGYGIRSATPGYAYDSAQAAAMAGGYTSANAYLGFRGAGGYAGASHAGAYGSSGASVHVGGQITAFAMVAAPGSLRNAGVPPAVALQQTDRRYWWGKSVSWPSAV